MLATTSLERRQLWVSSTSAWGAGPHLCAATTLPADGVLSFGPDNVVTLSDSVVFQPLCTDASGNNVTRPSYAPFHASATPQVFVVATAMVLAWVLVIMLIISPRTFYRGSGPYPFSSTRRGIITGAHGGSTSSMGIGSRPWLQKAAALTVAISLTIAVADTFIVSEEHYPAGIDGNAMRALVENSLEIRISRVVSDVFVLLAQVQTLIRVFPRHKEKVLIKWIGFALIVLDIIFSSLTSFLPNGDYRRPRDFVDAIPALSYLFELALSLLYMAWIIYYAFTKRRYAFYHTKMKTISIIACLALVAILTPTVFFVTDITLPNIAAWGDYFRWVGAAAASVVVWEWVERIEMLEKDEKKDGILGREIFEGDEMLDLNPSGEMTYHGRRSDSHFFSRGKGGSRETTTSLSSIPAKIGHNFFGMFRREINLQAAVSISKDDQSPSVSSGDDGRSSEQDKHVDSSPGRLAASHLTAAPAPPAPAVTPPNRVDTTSAASTVYVVRQDGNNTFQPVRRRFATPELNRSIPSAQSPLQDELSYEATSTGRNAFAAGWHAVSNPFKRKRTTPPAEIRAVTTGAQDGHRRQGSSTQASLNLSKMPSWDFRSQLGGLRSRAQIRPRERGPPKKKVEDLPWTIIPAQPRGKTWIPSPPPVSEEAEDGSQNSPEEGTARRDFQPTGPSPSQESGRTTASPDQVASQTSPTTSSERSSPALGTTRHGQNSDSIDARLRGDSDRAPDGRGQD